MLLVFTVCFKAQVLITDDPNMSKPLSTDAVLELYSLNNNKGLLMPKVSLLSTNNPSPIAAHLAGLTVYNTNTATVTSDTRVSPGFYYNDGISWNRVEVQAPTIGDVKYSAVATDHEGWYLLNG